MDDNLLKNFDSQIKNKAKSRDMYKIVFTNEDGKDIEYEIVATFRNNVTRRIYYIMTDNSRSDNNELNIMPFYVDYVEEVMDEIDERFYPVEDDEEFKMVMDVFNTIKNNI